MKMVFEVRFGLTECEGVASLSVECPSIPAVGTVVENDAWKSKKEVEAVRLNLSETAAIPYIILEHTSTKDFDMDSVARCYEAHGWEVTRFS